MNDVLSLQMLPFAQDLACTNSTVSCDSNVSCASNVSCMSTQSQPKPT